MLSCSSGWADREKDEDIWNRVAEYQEEDGSETYESGDDEQSDGDVQSNTDVEYDSMEIDEKEVKAVIRDADHDSKPWNKMLPAKCLREET